MQLQDRRLGYLVLLLVAILIAVGAGVFYQAAFAGNYLRVYFDEIGNLKLGDKVNFMGVPVGKVDNISRAPERNQALITILLYQVPPLYQGYAVKITDIGLFGSKEIQIFQGPGNTRADLHQPVEGIFLPGIADAIAHANNLQVRVARLSYVVDSLLGNQSSGSKNLVSQYQALIKFADSATLALNTRLGVVNGQVASLCQWVVGFSGDINASVKDLGTALPEYSQKILALTQSIDSLITQLDPYLTTGDNLLQATLQKQNTVGKILADDKMLSQLKKTLVTLDSVLKNISKNGISNIVKVGLW
jgi:ABC-type transporter Mla subunit MlaD